jgi:hypothetical protein
MRGKRGHKTTYFVVLKNGTPRAGLFSDETKTTETRPGVIGLERTRLTVEMVGEDVVGDIGGEEIGAGVAGFEALAEIGGGDVLVDGLKEVDAALLVRGEVEGREVVEREARAADDDPFGEFEELVGLAPVRESEEGVCADEVEEGVAGHELMKGGDRLDGVVGGAVGMRGVEVGDAEAWVGEAGEEEHGDAVGEGGG